MAAATGAHSTVTVTKRSASGSIGSTQNPRCLAKRHNHAILTVPRQPNARGKPLSLNWEATVPDVLILDDDVLLCELMADRLRDEGLDVLTAGNIETALDLLQEYGARVLVADKRLEVGAAREDGHRLAQTAARLYPLLSVVYITGEADALTRRALTARERALPKPFLSRDLVAAVREVLTK